MTTSAFAALICCTSADSDGELPRQRMSAATSMPAASAIRFCALALSVPKIVSSTRSDLSPKAI